MLIIVGCTINGRATAYDSQVVNNLNRSRDALLDQRQHLLQQSDDIAARIDQLQRQEATIQGYLKDTENNLRDVEYALNRARY